MPKIFRKKYDLALHYKNTFATESGKIVLADLVYTMGVLKSSFAIDSREHAFNEGQREPIRRILQMLNVDFEEAQRLLEAHAQYENKYQE